MKSMKSGNGNIIRKMIEDKIKENKEINLMNCDENNLFDIIIQLFNELFSKYSLFDYDNFYSKNQKRRIQELLLIVETSYLNFYYEENCPFNLSINNENIKRFNKDYYFEKENKLNDENKFRGLYFDKNRLGNNHSSNSHSFNYYILEKLIENSDNKNMIEISYSTNIEIVNNIEFLLNNPNIQSIFFLSRKSSFISIKSSNTFIFKKKKSNYKFYDKKYNF
jgi:hypothetical protein